MHAFKLKHPVPELQPIGSVSLLGATPTGGDPQVAGAMIYGEPQDAFTCGLFSSTEGSFTMTYPFTEHATVLEGEVELTVAGGEPQRFAPGTAGLSNRVPKWNGKSSPHVSSNTIWRTSRRANTLIMPGGALRLRRATKSHSAVAPVSGSATGDFEAKLKAGRTDRRPGKAQPPPGRNTRNVARQMAPLSGAILFINRHIHGPGHRFTRCSPPSGRYSLSRMPA